MTAPSKKQLLWRCRRGVRELDVLLDKFMSSHFDGLNEDEKSDFARFLEVQDPQIMDWLFNREQCQDKAFQRIINLLQDGNL